MPIQVGDSHANSLFAQRQTGLLFNLPVPDPSVEQLPEGISLCMIVKNEERFLAECLESVKDVVDEICIVDTGSTDRTVEIAKSYGAKMDFKEWRNDFSWARNQSLALATRRWTLVLDADEELASESRELVRALKVQPAALTAVYTNIVNFVDDPLGTGTMSHRLIRIFPTTPLLRYGGVIHECLAIQGEGEMTSVLTPITIIHKGYTSEMLVAREKDARNRPLLDRAYEEHGDDSFALFNFGNAAISSGDTDRGVEVLNRMLREAEGPPRMYFASAYLALIMAHSEHYRDYEKAIEVADEGLTKFPLDAGIIFTRGQIMAKLNRLDEAREAYESALATRDMMTSAVMTDEELFEWKIQYAMAGTYALEENYDKAIEWVDRALTNKPSSPQLRRAKAKFLETAGRMYDAEVELRKMVELEPRMRVDLVNFLLRRKRFSEAIALVEVAQEIKSDVVLMAQLKVAAARAMIEQRAGDPVPFLESALHHAPGNGNAVQLYEQILIERGDTARLERLHREELDAPLLAAEDFVRRSYRLLGLGRISDAQLVAEQGLQGYPGNAELRFNLALALLRGGNEVRATEELGRVDDKSAAVFGDASRMRASLLVKHGDARAAGVALRTWIASRSNETDAILESADLLIQGKARSEARALLENFVDVDRRVALDLAAMLLQDGDLQAAGAVADRALR